MPNSGGSYRTLAARIGGLSLHLHGDSAAIAARARKGLEQKFVNEALGLDPSLTGLDLDRKVDQIKRLYYTRLAKRSAETRARRRK